MATIIENTSNEVAFTMTVANDTTSEKISVQNHDIDHKDAADTTINTALFFTLNSIKFKVDNSKTSFNLAANTTTFADWGDFNGAPTDISARQTNDDTAKVTSASWTWTGSAGMIGYSVTTGGTTKYLRFAATNPYMSARSNRTMVAIYDSDNSIDQDNYNSIYNNGGSASTNFGGKTLKIDSNIGSANDATATFIVKWE